MPLRCVCSTPHKKKKKTPKARSSVQTGEKKNISISMHHNQAWYLHGNLSNVILITTIIWDNMINSAVNKSELCDCASWQYLQQKVSRAWRKSFCAINLNEVHLKRAKLSHSVLSAVSSSIRFSKHVWVWCPIWYAYLCKYIPIYITYVTLLLGM